MTDTHPPSADREADTAFAFGPRRQRPVVLRIEGPHPLHGLSRCSPMPRRRKLWIGASKHLVAPGSSGMHLSKYAPRSGEGNASALRLLPRAVLSSANTLSNARPDPGWRPATMRRRSPPLIWRAPTRVRLLPACCSREQPCQVVHEGAASLREEWSQNVLFRVWSRFSLMVPAARRCHVL